MDLFGVRVRMSRFPCNKLVSNVVNRASLDEKSFTAKDIV
jgi:hypothetical protein